MKTGATCKLEFPEGHNAILAVLQGRVEVGTGQHLGRPILQSFPRTGSGAWLRAEVGCDLAGAFRPCPSRSRSSATDHSS